jgi:IS5 family transposase
VQPKAISFPTDAKLLHAAIKGLNRLATRHGVRLRQSYSRVAKATASSLPVRSALKTRI